ncbi:hypothetical protein [Cupriavidus sp. D39]|uniref:hypothetical protein n=1 Tax=Cupriavidus sp. D39 TaxID=2997877 RepID=UPI00226F5C35|nr:hypothetical protein [Cupriavidus sp. D39]MCY0853247.1 hypothetical protein [Cupriavidus sp. D39]
MTALPSMGEHIILVTLVRFAGDKRLAAHSLGISLKTRSSYFLSRSWRSVAGKPGAARVSRC